MLEKDKKGETGIIDQYLKNKHWFIGSALFFLLAASIYLIFTPPRYKVTSRISLNNRQFPDDIVKDIRSRSLVQKAIGELPSSISYYYEKREITKDSLPLKFVLLKKHSVNSPTQVMVTILDNQRYQIDEDDTVTDFYFNKPVNYSFAKFIAVKGPAFGTKINPVTVNFNTSYQLFDEYYNNLKANFVDSNHTTLELSLTTTSPKSGKEFLDKLVNVYNEAGKLVNAPLIVNKDLQKASNELAALESKTKSLRYQQYVLQNNKKKTTAGKTLKQQASVQLNTLNAIEPYAKSPINQFVLIPDSYHVTDGELKTLIVQFNKMEWGKQHALQDSQTNLSEIINLNKQLKTVKESILKKIDVNKNEINQAALTEDMSGVLPLLHDSMLKINALLRYKQLEYNKLTQNRPQIKEIKIDNEKTDEHIITYPQIGYVYFFALLIGLVLPLVIAYIKHPLNQVINTKKLDENTIV